MFMYLGMYSKNRTIQLIIFIYLTYLLFDFHFSMSNNSKCIKCNVFLRKITGFKKVISTEDEANKIAQKIGREVKVNDILCNKCRVAVNKISTDKTTNKSCTSGTKNISQHVLSQQLLS